ncbi:MAG: hypothetical protein APR63_12570 [Desulfuromonas sp. SDB]|nr:MAG: hypothetical protein APR63_12570 [Desulfuromonas sp. SDB]
MRIAIPDKFTPGLGALGVVNHRRIILADKELDSSQEQSTNLNISISCPFCAGPVNYISGSKACQCRNCGQFIKIVLTGGIFSYRWNPHSSDLLKIARSNISNLLNGESYRILDEDGLYIPVWRASGRIIGWISGRFKIKTVPYVVQTGDGSSQTYFRKEGGDLVKRIVDTNSTIHYVDNSFIREHYQSLDFDQLEKNFNLGLFDEDKMNKFGKIFFPEKNSDEALRIFRQKLQEKITSNYNQDDYDYLHISLEVINYNLCIIFHPVYLVRFASERQEGMVLVDGVDLKVFGRTVKPIDKVIPKPMMKSLLESSLTSLVSFASGFLITRGSWMSFLGLIGLGLIAGYLVKDYYGS